MNTIASKARDLFNFRTDLLQAQTVDEILNSAENFEMDLKEVAEKILEGLKTDIEDMQIKSLRNVFTDFFNISQLRKIFINVFLAKEFEESSSKKEHWEKLKKIEEEICNHLQKHNSKSVFFCFGSYANGRINSKYSDLDFLVFLPHLKKSKDVEREMQILYSLKEIGFIFAKDLCDVEDCRNVIETGQGLVRLYGITINGVEVEFHIIGEKDAKNLSKIHHKSKVNRVRKVPEKTERRTSFTGKEADLLKNDSEVFHWLIKDGEFFRGFFIDAVIGGKIIYDNFNKLGNAVYLNCWRVSVKGYLYCNKIYKKEILLPIKKEFFDGFFLTFYYKDPNNYSQEKISHLEKMFYFSLGEILG